MTTEPVSSPPANLSRTLVRYALFQTPELVIGAGACLTLVTLSILPNEWGWALFGLWLAKDVVMFPFVRHAYEPSDPSVTSALIGKSAVVIKRLDPTGTVRLGPELWGARLAVGSESLDAGVRVCVKAVEGLTLHVERSSHG